MFQKNQNKQHKHSFYKYSTYYMNSMNVEWAEIDWGRKWGRKDSWDLNLEIHLMGKKQKQGGNKLEEI
jgi:hypothetical protein